MSAIRQPIANDNLGVHSTSVSEVRAAVPDPQGKARPGSGGGTDGPSRPPAWERKRTNKRINEQLKLFGSAMNALAAAVLGTSIIIPLVQNPDSFIENYNPVWFLGGASLHVFGLVIFGINYQSEE